MTPARPYAKRAPFWCDSCELLVMPPHDCGETSATGATPEP
jgi:hypothetical protein